MLDVRELVFLKLGGSLITDKNQRYTPRIDRLTALTQEIDQALAEFPEISLVFGHGSGSFGHFAVQDHLSGVTWLPEGDAQTQANREYWRGYFEVWYRASELNRHVMDALHAAGRPAISLAPSAMVQASDGKILRWDVTPLETAIATGLVPVVFGDIVFDAVRGSVVLSTEALMAYLAPILRPKRILLAGLEPGVWEDYPARTRRIDQITPSSYPGILASLGGSHGADVTGGMKAKVEDMLTLVKAMPDLKVHIISGEAQGSIHAGLAGRPDGTLIACD
jgi:isopentenyl phosphate kinase